MASSSGPGVASPKKRGGLGARSAGSLHEVGKAESATRLRAPRVKPLTPAEQAAQKEQQRVAYIARRKVLEEEAIAMRSEQETLLAQVARIDSSVEGSADAHLLQKRMQCDDTRAQVDAAKERLQKAERRHHDATARHSRSKLIMAEDLEAVQEELIEMRERCAQHEDRARNLFASSADMRELLQRGVDELQQLRGELWERQGEKALLVADQASAARLGAEQRVQAVAAEAQVTQLAQALDCEDSRLVREQRRLRRAEAQHQERAAGEKREMALASAAYPEQIQQEHEESAHCKKVAEEKRRELQFAQESLAKVRENQRQFAEMVRGKAQEAWQAEAARDSARSARESMEAETARVAAETKRLQAQVAHMADQNRQLMRDQVKARNECSALVQKGIRRDVSDYLQANPDMSSGGIADNDGRDRAARLGLAGYVTKLSPAGIVGPQR